MVLQRPSIGRSKRGVSADVSYVRMRFSSCLLRVAQRCKSVPGLSPRLYQGGRSIALRVHAPCQ